MGKLESDIAKVKAQLDSPAPEPSPSKGARKVAKLPTKVKKVEKGAKKAKSNGHEKESTPREAPEGMVSVAELAEEAGIGAQSARVKLRASEIERPEGRWLWKVGSKDLKAARKVLGLS